MFLLLACTEGDTASTRPGRHPRADTAVDEQDTAAEPSWACVDGATMEFSPAPVETGTPLTVSVTADIGYVWIGLSLSGPGSATAEDLVITGIGPYTWSWTVRDLTVGDWSAAFTADNGATTICTATFPVSEGGGGDPPDAPTFGASGTHFTRDGATFRFVGFNTRGLAHYGYGDILPWADNRDETLDAVESAGGSVIRVFAANQQIDAATTSARLGELLDACAARDIGVIVSLTDFYPTGFYPPGDADDYALDPNGYTTLTHDWFDHGYRDDYLPMVDQVVADQAGHPGLFAWELGNEIRDAWYNDTYLAWASDVSAHIRERDPETMLTGGLISTSSTALSDEDAAALYADFDFLTVHLYEGQTEDADFARAETLGKPIVVEEFGIAGNGRTDTIRSFVEGRLAAGADGAMQWGFMAGSSDNGDGDVTYGMDRVFHDDFDALTAAYAEIAAGL